jgi:hypothetical protein
MDNAAVEPGGDRIRVELQRPIDVELRLVEASQQCQREPRQLYAHGDCGRSATHADSASTASGPRPSAR